VASLFFAPQHYIRRASPHGRQDLAARPEVHRGRFPAVLLDLELDLLTFIERAQSGALDGGDVHEDFTVPRAIVEFSKSAIRD
jgi:hypothetical protein